MRVLALKSRYPQGAEKVLVQACTGRKVPEGKLPADVGCLVMNITLYCVFGQLYAHRDAPDFESG